MALQYPILFPYGEDGYTKGLPWNLAFKGEKPKTGGVSMRAFLVIYTVEFQKRGLSHCHILVWVSKEYECHSPSDVDSIISAKIPSEEFDKGGYDVVAQYTIHGPYGLANEKSPCMKEKKCFKKFPKRFANETTFESDSFVTYKRKEMENCFVVKNGVKLNNVFVVPYNRELLLNYQVHINIESCCQSMLIKYLFKYITKGVDRARVVFEDQEFDEIVAYLNCRYLCPYEAVWRLLQFHIHFREPAVQRLCVHLSSDQNVIFKDNDNLNYVANQPNLESTMLTKWFEMNTQDPNARQLFYVEFPSKYVWNSDNKEWTRRKNGRCPGRVAYVHPAAGELYYLRLLLNYQKGSFCFDDLKTIRGVLQPTFQAACNLLGLLGDDKEWNNAMLEAIVTASSHQLRQLFVTLVLFCDVADPTTLFEAHWKMMCDDISIKMINAFGLQDMSKYEDELKNSLLYELEKLFVASNSSLSKHHLPIPSKDVIDRLKNRSLREELNYDTESLKEQHSQLVVQLNKEQKIVYDSVIKVVDHNKSDRSLRDVLKGSKLGFDDLAFGGKPILFGGLNEKEKQELADFAHGILQIGNGSVANSILSTDEENSWVEISKDFLIDFEDNLIENMVSAVYTDFQRNFHDVSYLKERAIVTLRNDTMIEINDFMLTMVPSENCTYLSFDYVSSSTENVENLDILYPLEFLNQLDLPGLPHHKLALKVGMPIMLLRNLNQSSGLCNGTRLVVMQLTDRIVEAKIITGSNIGERVYIPRIITESSQNKYPFTLRRRQFPLRIFYAMTINKSRGQSLKIVGLFLSQTVFSHGQLYVALSRVTSKKGLKIVIAHDCDMPYGYTKNIVYKDVLNRLHED
ncbi:uncharacterized protein LOC108868623 [Pyrus x bretschneideri]|uniref:uncharacterized protein LOC108868623 n=1 Tax=Pyrus x bretschneideri TaxID=225117 RepID=UPI0020301A69|nr:uncharacterized protein LOC108868623 [Pyrus x bretschneideri]